MKPVSTILISATLILITGIIANAQKLPNVQQVSLYAPVNVKTDGNPTEWGDFQAYNKANAIYYTMANDKNNLYLAIQARGNDMIAKISHSGITFTVNGNDQKKDNKAVSIIFPKFDKFDPAIYLMLTNWPRRVKDSTINKMKLDSFSNALNHKLDNQYKLIGINGITAIKDSILSVYNDQGIKAAARFNDHLWYTYELCIPIRYLALRSEKFRYTIQLNGVAYGSTNVQVVGDKIIITESNGIAYGTSDTAGQRNIMFSTDFWGEYALAKK